MANGSNKLCTVQKYIFLKNIHEILNWCNGYYQFIKKVKNVKNVA